MTEWKIPQEMIDQSEEIKRLHAVISRLHAERRTNAIDGQCALDEANNRVAELEAEIERWEQSRDGVLSQLEEIECSKMALEADNKRLKEQLRLTNIDWQLAEQQALTGQKAVEAMKAVMQANDTISCNADFSNRVIDIIKEYKEGV